MNVHRRVVPWSITVLIGSSVDNRALVHRCCIAAYRPRRKKGRIKCDVEKRHSSIGAQKIVERIGDVLHFESDGDKMILSTPSFTKCLPDGRAPLPLHSAMVAQLPRLSIGSMQRRSKQRREHDFNDPMVTNWRAAGTKGRTGSWIHRSPTLIQRESPNAKSYGPWHERIVFIGFGLLTCMMFTRLTIISQHSSLSVTKLVLSRHFRLFTVHFDSLLFSFPAPNKQNQRYRVGQSYPTSQQLHERMPRLSRSPTLFQKLPAQIRPRSKPNLHLCPERRIGGSIPPSTHHFFE